MNGRLLSLSLSLSLRETPSPTGSIQLLNGGFAYPERIRPTICSNWIWVDIINPNQFYEDLELHLKFQPYEAKRVFCGIDSVACKRLKFAWMILDFQWRSQLLSSRIWVSVYCLNLKFWIAVNWQVILIIDLNINSRWRCLMRCTFGDRTLSKDPIIESYLPGQSDSKSLYSR